MTPNADDLSELLQVAQEKFEQSIVESRYNKKNMFNMLSSGDFNPQSIFFRFALNEPILKTVTQYLGYAPYLEYVKLIKHQEEYS